MPCRNVGLGMSRKGRQLRAVVRVQEPLCEMSPAKTEVSL